MDEQTLENGDVMCKEQISISHSEIKAYMNQFDSGIDAYNASTVAINEFRDDVGELCKSMSNLFNENKIPLAMSDAYVEITMYARGTKVMYSRIGTPDFTDKINEQMECKQEVIKSLAESLSKGLSIDDAYRMSELLVKDGWSDRDKAEAVSLANKIGLVEAENNTGSTE